jgi:hypothetical protein
MTRRELPQPLAGYQYDLAPTPWAERLIRGALRVVAWAAFLATVALLTR